MKITGIRLENVRVFEGEHFVPIDDGLTVLIGRNNAGKSTVLRAPFLLDGSRSTETERSSFLRSGAKYLSVALRVTARPEDSERILGLAPLALHSVELTLPQRDVINMGHLAPFKTWQSAPVIERGARWEGSSGLGTLRIAGQPSDEFLSASYDGQARLTTGGEDRAVHVNADPFGRAFAFQPLGARTESRLAYWEHHRNELATGWIVPQGRRLWDTDEVQLQEVLTFLRMKHSDEFGHVSRALHRALPEFGGLDFIEVEGTGFKYRPSFRTNADTRNLLARESVGSGAWAYLCILTAARAAKATGAKILFLDEPHLYMHPGLERLLIDELLDPALWDNEPLQIVAATHSPTFVNAAVEHGTLNVLEWRDEGRKSAQVRTIDKDNRNAFASLIADPGDLLYAERVIFVEGPSDVAALRILARDRCKVKEALRFVPLRETDAIAPDIAKFFAVVVQAGGIGNHHKALLFLDGDKKADLEKKWEPLGRGVDPGNTPGLEVVWSNPDGNDFESVFCDVPFLVAYFAALGVKDSDSRDVIKTKLATVASAAKSKSEKGCVAIRALHVELLGDKDTSLTKADDLERLMRFYVASAGETWASVVAARLKLIEEALKALGGERVG